MNYRAIVPRDTAKVHVQGESEIVAQISQFAVATSALGGFIDSFFWFEAVVKLALSNQTKIGVIRFRSVNTARDRSHSDPMRCGVECTST